MERKASNDMFKSLFVKYYEELYAYSASITKSTEVAEDVVMEAFNYLYSHQNKIRFDISVRPLLYKICRTKSIDYLRDNKRKIDMATIEELGVENEGAIFNLYYADRQRLYKKLLKEVEQMPTQRRLVFEGCFINDKSYKEVAAELGVSVNTIKSHVSAALKHLRQQFDKHEMIFFSFFLRSKLFKMQA